jgi:transmembrane sensor
MLQERLEYLFQQYLNSLATSAEEKELFNWALAPANESEVKNLLQRYWQEVAPEEDMPQEKADAMLIELMKPTAGKLIPLRRALSWRRLAIAASIILVLGAAGYLLLFNKQVKPVEVAQDTNEVKAPETNRAVIVLADGQKIYLDSVNNGQLAMQANVKLVKLENGKIVYAHAPGIAGQPLQYNTLSNPRGSRVIDIMLADGSHVWLNAGSSVTYPVAFTGHERKVTITGEAYFEVSSLTASPPAGGGGVKGKVPFIVNINGKASVEVLGTHFNINAYENEESIKTTLSEGKVKVVSGEQSVVSKQPVILKPGEQAQIAVSAQSNQSSPILVQTVDVDKVMAWKNGLFDFNGVGLQEVMRQIARWYDIEVVYEKGVPDITFGGKITKGVSLKGLLTGLEKSEVHFRIEGRKLIVLP